MVGIIKNGKKNVIPKDNITFKEETGFNFVIPAEAVYPWCKLVASFMLRLSIIQLGSLLNIL